MRRGRIFIYLALILIVGALALYFLSRGVFKPAGTTASTTPTIAPTPIPTAEVVVVTQHIGRAEVITEDKIGYVPIQKDLMIDGMFTDAKDVVGNISRLDLDSGIILMKNMVADTSAKVSTTGSDAALFIPKGKVAISIPISRLSAVSYAPQRGDHVNVIVTLMFVDLDTNGQSILPNHSAVVVAPGPQGANGAPPNNLSIQITGGVTNSAIGRVEVDTTLNAAEYVIPSEAQRPRLVSQTLIRDVVVLQVGNFALPTTTTKASPTPAATAAAPAATPQGQQAQPTATIEVPRPPDILTLIVSPQDAVTINYLIFGGAKLTLALRSPVDDTTDATEAVTLQFLLDRYGIPLPLKLPYGINPRVNTLKEPTLYNDTIVPTPAP